MLPSGLDRQRGASARLVGRQGRRWSHAVMIAGQSETCEMRKVRNNGPVPAAGEETDGSRLPRSGRGMRRREAVRFGSHTRESATRPICLV